MVSIKGPSTETGEWFFFQMRMGVKDLADVRKVVPFIPCMFADALYGRFLAGLSPTCKYVIHLA